MRSLKSDLMQALGTADLKLGWEKGQLQLHIDQPDLAPVELLDLINWLDPVPSVAAVLGLSDDGSPILLDFASGDITHVLISGISGAGKTALLRTIAVSLGIGNRQSQLQLVVLDPTENLARTGYADLKSLQYLPHMMMPVASHRDDVKKALQFLVQEMQYRRRENATQPTIVVLLDGVESLLTRQNRKIKDELLRLLQHGALVGIHLVLSTLSSSINLLDTIFQANMPIRIVGQVEDSMQAAIASGMSNSEAEFLSGQGDFIAIANGQVIHFQGAYIGDYGLHLTLEELHRKRPPILLAQPFSVSTAIATDSPSAVEQFVYDGQRITAVSDVVMHDETAPYKSEI